AVPGNPRWLPHSPLPVPAGRGKAQRLVTSPHPWANVVFLVLEGRTRSPAAGRDFGGALEGPAMRILFKIRRDLLLALAADLRRPHAFASERVGFLLCRPAALPDNGLMILPQRFDGVADGDYVHEPDAGATMGPAAIRKALQVSYNAAACMFHVHIHEHRGKPGFSRIDARETARFVPDFWNVQPNLPHGAIVLSSDSAFGKCWLPGTAAPLEISEFVVVGVPVSRL